MRLPPVPAPLCVILCFLCFLLGGAFSIGLLFAEAATRTQDPSLSDK